MSGLTSQPASAAPATPTDRPLRWLSFPLAVTLLLAVYIAGSPAVDAPWLQGDEHIFIVHNAEVTGRGLAHDSPWQRLKLIFRLPPQEDLYQPLPILSYAIEWTLVGNSPTTFRRTDVLLHALNALLFWSVLRRLLARAGQPANVNVCVALSWGLALIWALHPVLVSAWAADMGRTHLLAGTFALLALHGHLQALQPGRGALFVAAVAALIAAMMCKVIPGWVLFAFVLEAALIGGRRTLRSPRIYVIAVICAGFAALGYWTSLRVGLMQDASAGLFGDPLARSALAVWIYFRSLVAPLWLSTWYLPDPRTTWSNPLVWAGLALAALSIIHAARAWHRPERRGVAVGWAWCWALLLPMIGLIGAREAAATDRYLYQPLMGVLLALGTVLLRWLSRRPEPRLATAHRPIIIAAALLGAVLLLWDLPQARVFRSTLRRRERIAQLNPGDPRALGALARGYEFAANHRLDAADRARVPTDQSPSAYFLSRSIATGRQAANATNLARYFPGPADRAPFHRRLSQLFKMTGAWDDSLQQALLAHELQPDAFLTWVRLAHAFQGSQRLPEAVQAYERCEALLPDSPITRATHFTDFGYLILFELERPDLAHPKFRQAIETGRAPTLAYIGLARCEIRVGEGTRGFALIMDVLNQDPRNALAGLVLAEYHLRSHHWEPAARIYEELVEAYPTVYQRYDWYYEALRGFQSVSLHTDRLHAAAALWDQAARLHPDRRELSSFRVWALACDGAADTPAWAADLLANDADNPLACLAQMLSALQAGQVKEAVEWAWRAREGEPIPKARAFERALAVLRVQTEAGKLPVESALVEAAIYAGAGNQDRCRQVVETYLADNPDSQWLNLARVVCQSATTSPATQEVGTP